jgi:predicted ATPase
MPLDVRSIGYSIGVRIYFVGSHATGKTTLCRHVSRRYGLPMISEVARAVLAEMETGLPALRTDMDLVAEYQERVFARQVAVERMHEGRFVSDRAFDNLAYAAEHTTNAAAMMNDQRFRDYMAWVSEGVVFFLRPHQSLLKQDGVRSGVSWDSVLRIDGMVKLMLEQHGINYLPIESVSMQERVRAVEFVLGRCGLTVPKPVTRPPPQPITETLAPGAGVLRATIESWPYALVDTRDHEA